MGEENVSKKRDREDSSGELELGSQERESKRVHLASSDVWIPNSPGSSPGGEIDELENFGINNGIPEDILDTLDDGDTMPENQDLDSVIRSFEEEILQSSPSPSTKPEIVELRSDSGEYQLDLGYLLEASDDELGLPPTDSSSVEEKHPQQDPIDDPFSGKASEVADLGDMFVIENELPRCSDSFGFELGEMAGEVDDISNGGFPAVDGLFEYSEPLDPTADLSWLCGCT